MNKTFLVHNEVLSVISCSCQPSGLVYKKALRFILELGVKIIYLNQKMCLEFKPILRVPFVTMNLFFLSISST